MPATRLPGPRKTEAVTFKVPKDLKDWVDGYKRRVGMSFTDIVIDQLRRLQSEEESECNVPVVCRVPAKLKEKLDAILRVQGLSVQDMLLNSLQTYVAHNNDAYLAHLAAQAAQAARPDDRQEG